MTAPRMSLGSGARLVKAWTYGGVAACALLAIIAWFAFVGPAMSHVSTIKQQTSQAQSQNDTLRAKITRLEKANEGIVMLRRQVTDQRAALPASDGLPDLTRQLQRQAAAAQVGLTSITAGTPTVVGAGGPSTAPVPAQSGQSAVGKLYSIPITLVTTGSLGPQITMLDAVQTSGPRRALVTSVQLSPGTSATTTSIDRNVTMTVQMQIFVAPRTTAAEAQLNKQLARTPAN